ncbi:MAG: hypothetical protein OXU70_18325 [Gammaproteobacteria bacterium]|nr:hypothetical protein [Gammaproteobacteria bacterium]
MPFRLREDAERWFAALDGREPAKTKFDLYYFCLMAGLASGRTSNESDFGAREIIDEFIQDYQPSQRLLIGLLVAAELRQGGIDFDEREAVRRVFSRLVTPESKTQLTDEGMRCMNAYASGGYDFLSESRDAPPASPEEFIRDFVRLIDNAVEVGAKSYGAIFAGT